MVEGAMLARDGPGDDDDDELADIDLPDYEVRRALNVAAMMALKVNRPHLPHPPRSLLRLPLPQRIHHTTHMSFASSCL